MTNKIKFFVGFLALITFFSVLTFSNSFKAPSSSFLKSLTGSILEAVDQDADKDGLTNREESYWNTNFQNPDTDEDGFLDGEEVASGHDPIIPGPNDLLDNGNLTNKLSGLTLSGLYEGSLKPDSPNYDKSLNDMALAVTDDATDDLSSKIDAAKFKIIDHTKENQEIYLEEISVLYTEFIKNFGEEVKNIQKYLELIGSEGFKNKGLINFFQARADGFEQTFEKGYNMNVPENWTPNHANFLHIVKNLQLANDSIAHGSDDPIKASAALNTIGDTFENLSDLVDSFTTKIKFEKLNNRFFNSLSQ